jgi:hypothetical protein
MEFRTANGDPSTLPTKAELGCLKPGVFVRLSLETGERFWAMVTSRKGGDGTFTGTVEDTVPPIRRGDAVTFKRMHVYEIV